MTIYETRNNLSLPAGALTDSMSRAPGGLAEHLDVQSVDWFSASTGSALPITFDAAGGHGERCVEAMVDDILAALLR